MKVWIEADSCTGSGLCAAIEPRVFDIGEDGLARVRQDGQTLAPGRAAAVPAEYADTVWEASDCCPGDCIRVHDGTDAR